MLLFMVCAAGQASVCTSLYGLPLQRQKEQKLILITVSKNDVQRRSKGCFHTGTSLFIMRILKIRRVGPCF